MRPGLTGVQIPESFAYGSLSNVNLSPIVLNAKSGAAEAGKRTNVKSHENLLGSPEIQSR